MHHLHVLAHQCYEERIREAERQVRFLADCGMPASGQSPVGAGTSSQPLRRLVALLRQLGRAPVVRRA